MVRIASSIFTQRYLAVLLKPQLDLRIAGRSTSSARVGICRARRILGRPRGRTRSSASHSLQTRC